MRFGVDTGGTFTDVVVEDDAGELHMFKSPTTPDNPIQGVLDALAVAAAALNNALPELLGRGEMFIYGTTHAINAIITGNTARTAFLTTAGHPDVLTLREGGRSEPFNFTVPYPEPYVPRSLTFELPGRILSDGSIGQAFDEAAMLQVIEEMKRKRVEAVAVCLLWSIINPDHELAAGALLERHMPGVPYTLSHRLNPTLREYRRASSACIDASLKPMMAAYMERLTRDLRASGFAGRVLVITSQGGVIDAAEVAAKPIHLVNSGPSMAPISGRHFAQIDEGTETAIIADAGGTTYDVSLVSRGRIPWTRETWIGQPFRGHMTGFSSVDVKSVGAGGGSIAWVDDGGMLHVGPKSAGAVPGPACYGKGGVHPTVTDAAVVLGYIDPDFFLGGSIPLVVGMARAAVEEHVARRLRLSVEDAAVAIIDVVTENMVQAIMEITVNQGVDPGRAILVGGGGAAGINSVLIARRLGSPCLLIPEVGAALSAAGALMSDLTSRFHATRFCETRRFDYAAANTSTQGPEGEIPRLHRGAGRRDLFSGHPVLDRGALSRTSLGDRRRPADRLLRWTRTSRRSGADLPQGARGDLRDQRSHVAGRSGRLERRSGLSHPREGGRAAGRPIDFRRSRRRSSRLFRGTWFRRNPRPSFRGDEDGRARGRTGDHRIGGDRRRRQSGRGGGQARLRQPLYRAGRVKDCKSGTGAEP